MAYNKTETEVLSILESILLETELSVWDVAFLKEGKDYFLRVFLDKAGGVSIDDCESVSRALEAKLDETDPIPQAYMLEVSSAGLDRAIKYDFHFDACMGKQVDVKLFAPYPLANGKKSEKEFTATLSGYREDAALFTYENEPLEIPRDKISQLRLTVTF